jgi:ketosteroid isomerase-like protein
VTDRDREPARDPQQLEPFLVARQHAGDIDGMLELFEPEAVIDTGDGPLIRGIEAIRQHFEALETEGRRFSVGVQQPALVNGDLALTSTRSPDGSVTGEVARRQPDGTWRWVIDQYSIAAG